MGVPMSIYSSTTFEALSQHFHRNGLSLSLSKILALFLMSEKEIIAMKEIIKQLGISKSTASVEIQKLEQMQFIEKTFQPNHRGYFYRLLPNVWSHSLEKKQGELSMLQTILNNAQKELSSIPSALKELKLYVTFMELEWPKLIARWHKYKVDNDDQ